MIIAHCVVCGTKIAVPKYAPSGDMCRLCRVKGLQEEALEEERQLGGE